MTKVRLVKRVELCSICTSCYIHTRVVWLTLGILNFPCTYEQEKPCRSKKLFAFRFFAHIIVFPMEPSFSPKLNVSCCSIRVKRCERDFRAKTTIQKHLRRVKESPVIILLPNIPGISPPIISDISLQPVSEYGFKI